MDGAALPQTFDQSQLWYTNVCAGALRLRIHTEAKKAADPRCPYIMFYSARVAPPPNCLEITSTSTCNGFGNPVSSIDEDTIANDQRVLRAGVSQEEARIYIREVNAHLAKSIRPKDAYIITGFLTCVTWALISGAFIMNAVLYKEPRLRCDARDGVCRGGDPLVDNCCVFWCCGKEMAGRNRRVAADRELPARPYDRWDVWANRTHFNNTAGCSINDKKFDGEKNDRDYDCLNCPFTRKRKKCDRGHCEKVNRACKTMYEGKASHYAVEWPRLDLLFLASVFAAMCMISTFATLYHRKIRQVYDEAFAEWRRRGIVTHVEFVPAEGRSPHGGGGHPAYLRLFFPITSGADGTTGSNVVTTPSSPSMFTARVAPVVPVATVAPSTFTVQVPPDGSAGQVMQLQAPNGVMLQVQIPFGCAAGSTFEVAMPARA